MFKSLATGRAFKLTLLFIESRLYSIHSAYRCYNGSTHPELIRVSLNPFTISYIGLWQKCSHMATFWLPASHAVSFTFVGVVGDAGIIYTPAQPIISACTIKLDGLFNSFSVNYT